MTTFEAIDTRRKLLADEKPNLLGMPIQPRAVRFHPAIDL